MPVFVQIRQRFLPCGNRCVLDFWWVCRYSYLQMHYTCRYQGWCSLHLFICIATFANTDKSPVSGRLPFFGDQILRLQCVRRNRCNTSVSFFCRCTYIIMSFCNVQIKTYDCLTYDFFRLLHLVLLPLILTTLIMLNQQREIQIYVVLKLSLIDNDTILHTII